jgi:hypothetical protein
VIENVHEVTNEVVLKVAQISSETILDFAITVSVEKQVDWGLQYSVKHRVVHFVARVLFFEVMRKLLNGFEGKQKQKVLNHFLDE